MATGNLCGEECRRLLRTLITWGSGTFVEDARWVSKTVPRLEVSECPANHSLITRHIEITPEHHGNLFFWHYQNRHIANKQRTVIWLNGGPGCSSLDGAMMEIGPYRVREGGKLEYNDGSWDEFANVLFVDNPVGTGFSYVDSNAYLHELDEMTDQFMIFLEKWFTLFPEYEHDDVSIVDIVNTVFKSHGPNFEAAIHCR